jgi:hypothetical protein
LPSARSSRTNALATAHLDEQEFEKRYDVLHFSWNVLTISSSLRDQRKLLQQSSSAPNHSSNQSRKITSHNCKNATFATSGGSRVQWDFDDT